MGGAGERPVGAWSRLAAVLCLVAWGAAPARGEPLSEADMSLASRQEAMRSIPWSEIPREAQDKLRKVLARPTLYRRMPLHEIRSAPEMYLFVTRHPEVMVNIWEVLRISRINLRLVADRVYETQDQGGTKTRLEIVHASERQHVFLAEGEYRGPLFASPLRGRGVLLLTSEFSRDEDGVEYALCRLDVFMQLDGLGTELLAKTLQGMVGKVADQNFQETANFVEKLSYTSEVNPAGMQRLASKLERCPPEVRQEFSRISAGIGERAAAAELMAENGPALEDSRPATLRGQD